MSLKARPAFFKMPRQAIARACRGFWIYLTRRNGTWSAIQEFLFKGIPSTATTIDHATWQHCLLNQRLRLVLWVYLLCLISVVSLDLYRLQFLTIELDRWDFLVEAAIALGLVGCLILQRTSFGQRHPEWLFLGASWSVTMVLQLSHTLRGYADEDLHAWNLVFLTQAIFIPMRWRLHLTSQLLPLAYFFTVNPLLGLELKPPVEMPFSTAIPDVALLAFWMCFICDLGVFMYDRLQRAEFEARQELRVFLHAVSHDLRNPVAGMLLVLGNLLSPRASKLSTQSEPSDIVPVPRRVLEQIVQSGDRQLNLLESLLEAHQNEMKGMVLHCKPLALHTFVPCAIAELQPILAEHQATSELRIA
ncbi:MAG: hypothetical protein HC925_05400, partial [Coleofasciculaceae cyanobacterium SM2_3_26]|nr:hypothetical protein [Coleofasciculaceae cyanobacterium SM2_3_26]